MSKQGLQEHKFNMTKQFSIFSLWCLLFLNSSAQHSLHVADTFHIKSGGGWDYILADPMSNHLFVSHGTQVNVLDKTNGDSLGIISNTIGIHGIALVHDLNKGF